MDRLSEACAAIRYNAGQSAGKVINRDTQSTGTGSKCSITSQVERTENIQSKNVSRQDDAGRKTKWAKARYRVDSPT